MHKWLILVLITMFTISCKNESNPVEDEKLQAAKIDSIEAQASKLYTENPKETIRLLTEVSALSRASKDYKRSGTANLNIAGLYDERFKDYSSALKFSYASLADWEELKEPLQIANLKKYVGVLEGLNGNFEAAKKYINEAIGIYETEDYQPGIAVSNINMAKVCLFADELKEGEKFFLKSKTYWSTRRELSRVFDNNLTGIEIYQKMKDVAKANVLIQENLKIDEKIPINDYLTTTFDSLRN